jgi:hypothetical protein
MSDDALTAAIRAVLVASLFHGEGHRGAWKRAQHTGNPAMGPRDRRAADPATGPTPARSGGSDGGPGACRFHSHARNRPDPYRLSRGASMPRRLSGLAKAIAVPGKGAQQTGNPCDGTARPGRAAPDPSRLARTGRRTRPQRRGGTAPRARRCVRLGDSTPSGIAGDRRAGVGLGSGFGFGPVLISVS